MTIKILSLFLKDGNAFGFLFMVYAQSSTSIELEKKLVFKEVHYFLLIKRVNY